MIDCGKCGYEMMRQEEDGYVCGHCGRKYTREEAAAREEALGRLERKRKLQMALMAGCALFLVICAFMLPGYTKGAVTDVTMLSLTGVCLAFFVAALAVRIRFGRERRKLYSDE